MKYIKNMKVDLPALALILFMVAGCMQKIQQPVPLETQSTALYILEDGQMLFRSRPVNRDDVFIYQDGLGGERAAIKVRSPIHPDFYRDSTVIRVMSQRDDSIGQNDALKQYQIN